MEFSNEIRSAVLIVHGQKAHSCYFSQAVYERMIKDSPYAGNKELLLIPNATHTDLYDGGKDNFIPFAKLTEFFNTYLK